jgi:hypothetical protein
MKKKLKKTALIHPKIEPIVVSKDWIPKEGTEDIRVLGAKPEEMWLQQQKGVRNEILDRDL